MASLAREIKELNPSLLVAVTPHGHVFSDAVTITALDRLEGDLAQFGAHMVRVEYEFDKEAAEAVNEHARKNKVPCALLDEPLIKQRRLGGKLDHGLVVPLSFVAKAGWRGKLVPVNMGFLPYEELYHFGAVLREALDSIDRDWVLLVSGDMSHCLLPGAPAGYSPQGAVFDGIVRRAIREGDARSLFNLEHDFVEEAAECGLRPLIIGFGALDGFRAEGEELSYEGPFGVGYLTAKIKVGERAHGRELVRGLYRERREKLESRRENESLPVRLARLSIREYLEKGRFLSVPEEAACLRGEKAGVFVSLKKHGNLRGCIGTVEPVQHDLALEIIHNAVSAAFHDPRFEPLEADELDELEISVDVLDRPEPVAGIKELDPQEYGVIVSQGSRRGLLLPNLPGISSAEEQVKIAGQKAGISPGERVKLEKFRVTRYT
jgi:AmmeMemoRadiSam system protein A